MVIRNKKAPAETTGARAAFCYFELTIELPPADGLVGGKYFFDQNVIVRVTIVEIKFIGITITVENLNQGLDVIIGLRTVYL